MRLNRMLTYLSLAGIILCFSAEGNAGSQELAEQLQKITETREPNDWPSRCKSLRAEIEDELESPARRTRPVTVDSWQSNLRVGTWRGITIPIPNGELNDLRLVPGSIAAIGYETSSMIISRLDLAPHFKHFGGIEGFSEYAESGMNLIDWIDRGLALKPKDIQCRLESMTSDVVRIVHSLISNLAITVRDESILMRLCGSHPAILLGEMRASPNQPRIQYVFQNPDSDKAEFMFITYDFDQPGKIIEIMSNLASAIAGEEERATTELPKIIEAILDGDYSRASSVAETSGITIRIIMKGKG